MLSFHDSYIVCLKTVESYAFDESCSHAGTFHDAMFSFVCATLQNPHHCAFPAHSCVILRTPFVLFRISDLPRLLKHLSIVNVCGIQILRAIVTALLQIYSQFDQATTKSASKSQTTSHIETLLSPTTMTATFCSHSIP
jgi:hypothetical protein